MSVASIRAIIKAKLESVSAVGIVHDYYRNTIEPDDYKTLFVDNNKVNAWILQWVAPTTGDIVAKGSMAINRSHTFRITGFYSIKDINATEKTFDDIVEDVMDELDKSQVIGTGIRYIDPSQLASKDEHKLSEVLCHRCVLNYRVQELRGFTP